MANTARVTTEDLGDAFYVYATGSGRAEVTIDGRSHVIGIGGRGIREMTVAGRLVRVYSNCAGEVEMQWP